MIATLDQKTFDALLQTPGVHVVDFTATWCGPCRAMLPVIAALEREYAGHARFVAVDVDEEPQLAQRFDVRSMPTFVILRDGREVARIVGARRHAVMAEAIDRAIG